MDPVANASCSAKSFEARPHRTNHTHHDHRTTGFPGLDSHEGSPRSLFTSATSRRTSSAAWPTKIDDQVEPPIRQHKTVRSQANVELHLVVDETLATGTGARFQKSHPRRCRNENLRQPLLDLS